MTFYMIMTSLSHHESSRKSAEEVGTKSRHLGDYASSADRRTPFGMYVQHIIQKYDTIPTLSNMKKINIVRNKSTVAI